MPARRRWLSLTLTLVACRGSATPPAVEVELAGGAHPGVYQSRGTLASCVGEATGDGGLGVQFTDWTGPKDGLRSLSLVLPSATRPDDFYLGLVFGDFFAGSVLEIDTRAASPAPRGHGVVSLVPVARRTIVTVTGATADAVALTATIICATVEGGKGTEP